MMYLMNLIKLQFSYRVYFGHVIDLRRVSRNGINDRTHIVVKHVEIQ